MMERIQIDPGSHLTLFVVFEQLLHEEAEASEAEWDELSGNVSSLRDTISPAAAAFVTEQLDGQRDR